MDTMKHVPGDAIDLTVTSPPYGKLRKYKGFTFCFEEIAKELYRVTKEIGFNLHDTMIFRKTNPVPQFPSIPRYTNDFEYMFVLSKGKPKTFSVLTTRTKTAGRRINKNTRSAFSDQSADKPRDVITVTKDTKRLTNTWEIGVGSMNKEHPAVFPEQLAKDHVISWSNPGDLVYDPFMGSGTTAVAALSLGRDYLGSEISPEYVELAEERLKKVKITLDKS